MNTIHSFFSKSGFKAHHLRLTTIGRYSPRDSEWNYSDIPHLNYVHTKVDGLTLISAKTNTNSIFLQRVGFLTLPASVTILHSDQGRHDYMMTILNLVIHVVTTHEAHEVGCKTTTSYSFYYRSFAGYIMGLLARIMTKRNYSTLMQEDLPMRRQRGVLRSRGVRFAYDSQDLIGFEETNSISEDHVDVSSALKGSHATTLIPIYGDSGYVAVDDYFLGVKWNKDFVFIVPLICAHEGAPLSPKDCDVSNTNSVAMVCPWHGRKIKSLKTLARRHNTNTEVEFCSVSFEVSLISSEHNKKITDKLSIALKNPEA